MQAVSHADAVTSPKHPRAVPLLVPLGIVFARTQRITYAEGIFRCGALMITECRTPPELHRGNFVIDLTPHCTVCCRSAANIVGLDPNKCSKPNVVHASTASCLSWRYAQLLAAMPKRDTETEAWQSCAKKLFEDADNHQGSLADAFGDLHYLQGKGVAGAGVLADVVTRRMLPCE